MQFDKDDPIFIGYHGTDETNSQSILSNNFRVTDSDEWIGSGAYFFIEGLSQPIDSAREWAVSRSNRYDTNLKRYQRSYSKYSVIEALITAEPGKILDLICEEGRTGYEAFKEAFLEDALRRGISLRQKGRPCEGLIVNEICAKYSMDIVLAELVITTSRAALGLRLRAKIPNKTVMAVRNPESCIHLDETRVKETGDVEAW